MTAAESLDSLIDECQGLVKSIALKIHRGLPRQVNLDDMISDGQVALAEAAREYDPSRGARFSTYAYYRIRGAIYDGLARSGWWTRRSRESRCEELAGDAVAESNATPQDDAHWLSSVTGSVATVFLLSQTGSEDHSAWGEIEDRSSPPPETSVEDAEAHEILRGLVDRLPEDMAKLIRGVYFDGRTLHDVGVDMKISKGWASRLHARALERLAQSLRCVGAES